MIKKLSSLFILVVLLASFSLSCFAADLIKITRPDGDETTFKKSYVISGYTDQEDVTVELAVYDKSVSGFVPLNIVDQGTNTFQVGASGIFMKEVALKVDANKIQITAYKGTVREKSEVKPQVKEFTVTVLEESIKDKLKGGVLKVTDVLKSMLKDDDGKSK